MANLILVVDDEPDVLELFQTYLKANGFRTVGAMDARSAWQELKKKKPDLILLDVMLPDKSGLDFCSELVKNPLFDIPVIMVSAKISSEDIKNGLESGARDYLTKPVDFDLLFKRIRTILGPKT